MFQFPRDRERAKAVTVVSMTGNEEMVTVWSKMILFELYQRVRELFGIPTHATSISIALIYLGSQCGQHDIRPNTFMPAKSNWLVPQSYKGTT